MSQVFIVTGGYAGVGLELSKLLYQKNSKIYIAGRSALKATQAIQSIKTVFPSSTGALEFLPLDLADLSTIKASASAFLAHEDRLDVLWNNAGVMTPPQGSKSAQGYELQLATNCLGPFLFTRLLQPVLAQTAAREPPGAVRVLFTGSVVAEINAPKGGINFEDINHEKGGSAQVKYGQSKVGNIFLAAEFARRNREAGEGVVFAVSFLVFSRMAVRASTDVSSCM
jgi:retinol dehydrogenase 12